MFTAWIKQKTRTCLNHTCELITLQTACNTSQLPTKIVAVGIQPAMIQCQRDAAVAEFGEQFQALLGIVMSQTVCVVTQFHSTAFF